MRQARFRVRSRPTSRACGSLSNPRASGLNCSKMGGTQHASLGRARRELGNEGILSATDALFIAGLTSSTRSGTQAELIGGLMCDTAKYASHSFDERVSMGVPVLHFDLQSLHQIRTRSRTRGRQCAPTAAWMRYAKIRKSSHRGKWAGGVPPKWLRHCRRRPFRSRSTKLPIMSLSDAMLCGPGAVGSRASPTP